MFRTTRLLSIAIASCFVSAGLAEEPEKADKVSYFKHIRPLLQAKCQGCHQPAKAGGKYVMTDFESLLKGGASKLAAVVAGEPDESYLLDLITPEDGTAEMPKNQPPLSEAEINLIKRWIADGAADDSPEDLAPKVNADNPPSYVRPPVVTSLDYSPDGSLIAVSGYHEVLLHKADGSALVGRLVGLSERIESVRFSPDGTLLAVAGGSPARMGEVQVWDVKTQKLKLSHSITYDTTYGVSWSPDGQLIAFGCADTSVRAINVKTGKEVFFQGSHDDWVLGTVFSAKGTHLISVARDRTAKLSVVETQRFIDNITSITPGVLKGGISAVTRHPQRDEILVGGADGVPKIYRVFRQSKRVIGDDANLIRKFPPSRGRVFDVAISPDGSRIAAGSSLDGSGDVRVYSYDFDTSIPKDILAIMSKVSRSRSAAERKKLSEYHAAGVNLLASTDVDESGIYAVRFHPSGEVVAAAGSDGVIRLVDAETGLVNSSFLAVPLGESRDTTLAENLTGEESVRELDSVPEGIELERIEVSPSAISLTHPLDRVQVIVNGHTKSGGVVDLTRSTRISGGEGIVEVTTEGLTSPVADGLAKLRFEVGDNRVVVPAVVAINGPETPVSYVRDIMPVLSKLGCNAGTCHGAKDGKNGFKLSLRGYDPIFDVRALTDDHASRRVNIASPDTSLMLLKATGVVPHVGSRVVKPKDRYYEILRRWITEGARLDDHARVASITVLPKNPVVQKLGSKQQVRVMATYADGAVRDVTAESFIESGNTDIAASDSAGLVTALRRGEAPILARYEGAYDATTLTVMGDRTGFVWEPPPVFNQIDEFVAAKWRRTKTLPSGLCTDAEFIRRVYIDLTGLPPTPEQVRKFLADDRATEAKRNELIDQLIGNEAYIEHWANKWADLLQVNRKFLGPEGAATFRKWIQAEVSQNTPYDQFARKILTASGSNKENPPASYYKILRTPQDTMENTTHLFLAVRFNCNKCHDHPFERWTQDQYYQMAAFFAQVGLKKDPASGKKEIGRTAVEPGKPLYEIVFDKTDGEVSHDRTGAVTPPVFPYDCEHDAEVEASRRAKLAAWITSADNQYFAKSHVNRLWGYLLGVGLIEPLDDIRAGNPPSNAELLDYLTNLLIDSGFDSRKVIREICRSRTYQLSVATNKWNEDDSINYSHATARRLPAEVLFDSIHLVTGSVAKLPGVPEGTRAAALPDAGIKLPSGFLADLGRPARESACECERTSSMQLGPVIAMVSGPTVGNAIADPNNALAKLANSDLSDEDFVNELFLRILNRPARESEIAASIQLLRDLPNEHARLANHLAEYEKQLQPILVERARKRQEEIVAAKADLEAYRTKIAPKVAELEKQRKERIAAAETKLSEYEKLIPEKLAAYEQAQKNGTVWTPVDMVELAASNGAKLNKEKDLSVIASGKNGKGTYTVSGDTTMTGIRGVRLEILTDKRLPSNGPGRSPNGNFVLTEFRTEWAPKSDPKAKAAFELQKPKADFSQDNYNIATVLDKKQAAVNNGWATSPRVGQNRIAVFEVKKPFGASTGTRLTFHLDQKFADNKHQVGKFRISITSTPGEIQLKGLPDSIAAIVAINPEKRSADQKAALLKHFRSVDSGLLELQKTLAEAKKPVPIDPGLKQRQENLVYVSKPLPPDATLVQLKADVVLSAKQLETPRLTAAQDISWALINSPAFIFNR